MRVLSAAPTRATWAETIRPVQGFRRRLHSLWLYGTAAIVPSMTDAAAPAKFHPQPISGGRMLRVLSRPRALVLGSVALLSTAGWGYCGLMVASAVEAGQAAALGPGMAVFGWIADGAGPAAAWLRAICEPGFAADGATAPIVLVQGALVLCMWCAMTLAMMLPTAAPMLLTYAELAETASRQREPAVSPLVLAAGYLCVWGAFAVVATGGYLLLRSFAIVDEAMRPFGLWMAAAMFVAAGLYQFSALKRACLRVCQRPFPFFFANWTTKTRGIFRLGLRQGLYCLGCCWTAMFLMFVVGLMNVIWMAGLGIVMAVEKMSVGQRFSRVFGLLLVCIGIGLALQAWLPLQ
ncbi:MAG TPA: DUF2182 domain-containing protein [Xanthobacteraceae bacterium]|nr:DUF2182 domain-containing protein [Xanthobacteraceae bacterium]